DRKDVPLPGARNRRIMTPTRVLSRLVRRHAVPALALGRIFRRTASPLLAMRVLGRALHLRVPPAHQQRTRGAYFGADQAEIVRRVEQARIPAPPPRQNLLDPFTQRHRAIRWDRRTNLMERPPRGKRLASHFLRRRPTRRSIEERIRILRAAAPTAAASVDAEMQVRRRRDRVAG